MLSALLISFVYSVRTVTDTVVLIKDQLTRFFIYYLWPEMEKDAQILDSV